MKKREGFVSNSSSSSFVIRKINGIDFETIEKMLNLLVEAYNLMTDTPITVSEICWLSEVRDVDEIGLRGWNFCNHNKITLKQFKAMNEHGDEAIPGFEIESTYDNSIPWPIMNFLENFGTRYHWG